VRLTCDSPSGSANSSKLAWPAGQRPNSAVNRSAMKSRSDVYKPCAHGNQSGIQVWGGGFCWFNPGTSLQFRGCFWRVGRIVIDDPLPIAARLCQPVDRLPRPTGNCSARLSCVVSSRSEDITQYLTSWLVDRPLSHVTVT